MKKRTISLFGVLLFSSVSLFFSACSKDDEPKIDTTPIQLLCGDSQELISRGNSFNITDEFVASVSGTTIKGDHVGQTTLQNEKGNSIDVTVTGKVKYIDEPCTKWGASLAEVRAAQKSGSEYGTTNDQSLMFQVKSGSTVKYVYVYLFEDSKLKSSAVLVPVSEVSTLVDWLAERYFMLPITGDSKIAAGGYNAYKLENSTITLGITAETVNSSQYQMYSKYYYMVIYMNSKSTRSDSPEFTEILQKKNLVLEKNK